MGAMLRCRSTYKLQFLKLWLLPRKRSFLCRKVTHNNILTMHYYLFFYIRIAVFRSSFHPWTFLYTIFKFHSVTILPSFRHLLSLRFYLPSHPWNFPFGTAIPPFPERAQSSILTLHFLFEALVFTALLTILLPGRWREQVSTYLPDYTECNPRKP